MRRSSRQRAASGAALDTSLAQVERLADRSPSGDVATDLRTAAPVLARPYATGPLVLTSPLLAATMTISLASLAGIPPLAGFFGKFLLLKSVVEAAKVSGNHGYYCLIAVALAGVVMSLYYYFNVVRVMYWSREVKNTSSIPLSAPAMVAAWVCIGGIFWLGLFPNTVLNTALSAAAVLK